MDGGEILGRRSCVCPHPLLYTVGAEDEAKQVHASSCASVLSLSLGTTVERERVERGAARRYTARVSLSNFSPLGKPAPQ